MSMIRKREIASKPISMTSLLDVLTIILVFLIKNVSTEGQKVIVPEKMQLPTSISKEELIKNGLTVLIKIYPDRMLIGGENLPVLLKDLMSDVKTREYLNLYMQRESKQIMALSPKGGTKYEPCLLIQADKSIECQYVTQIIKIGAGASFANIYFSTLQDETWLQKSAAQGQ